jgi:hypothetical protein
MIPKQISSRYHKKNENKQDSPKCYTLNNALGVRQYALGGGIYFKNTTPLLKCGSLLLYIFYIIGMQSYVNLQD